MNFKNNYTTKLGLIIFSVLLISNYGCKKILEQEPRNSTYDQVFWQSARDCESALAGNYALLRNALTAPSAYDNNAFRYYMYGDAQTSASTYFTMNYSGDGLEGIQGGDFTFQYNIQSLGDWTNFYKVIAMSNLIIKKIPEIRDEKLERDVTDIQEFKDRIIGQALFIRAFTYFELTKVYGDVPLVTESYDDVLHAPHLPRADRAEVLDQIEEDCHKAANLLGWTYESQGERAVTANKGSVYALLAHMYLWRATTTNLSSDAPVMSDVNSADTTLKVLIDQGGYQLQDTTNYGTQFIGQSSESIFEIAMSESDLEGAWNHIGMGFLSGKYISGYGSTPRFWVPDNYFSVHYYVELEGYGEGWVWWNNEWQWLDLIVRGAKYFIIENGDEVDVTDLSDFQGGYAYVYHPEIDDYTQDQVGFGNDLHDVRYRNNFDLGGTQGQMCVKYKNIIYRNPSRKTEPYMSNNLILFRLSDMMLLRAEVALYKNDLQSAADQINFFRDRNNSSSARVKVEDGKPEILYQYMIERGREMYLEGHLYFDLIRTRMYREFIPWMSDGRFALGGFYWPIVPTLFQDNGYLTQTLYWRGKV